MQLSMLAVRIPEAMHKYIKHKSVDTGKQQQEIVAEMIALYQKQDAEYMAKFQPLIQADQPSPKGVEVANGA